MKKWKIMLPVMILVLACTACGGNEDKSEEKTENDVVTEQSEDINTEESKTYTIVSETEDVGIEITIPGEFQDTEYSSESWLALEIPGEDADSSTQLMMSLKSDEIDNVGQAMFEEVNYLMSANTDTSVEIGESVIIYADNHEWAYITYELEGLKGYKMWAEMENDTVLAGTVEIIGDSQTVFDIESFICQIDKTIKAE